MVGKQLHSLMTNAPRQETAGAALAAVSAVQGYPEQSQGLALLGAALLYIEGKGLDLQDTMTLTRNLIASHDHHLGTDFEAVRLYVENEL